MPDGKSLVCARLKRKRPILETNDGELHELLSNDADDFPTAFNFRSNRPVRRRLCTQLAETNDGELHGSPSSHANDFPTAFNFRSNRPVRRRSYTQLTDFPRPDSAMAAQSRKNVKHICQSVLGYCDNGWHIHHLPYMIKMHRLLIPLSLQMVIPTIRM